MLINSNPEIKKTQYEQGSRQLCTFLTEKASKDRNSQESRNNGGFFRTFYLFTFKKISLIDPAFKSFLIIE